MATVDMLLVRPETVKFTMSARELDEPKPKPCGPTIDKTTQAEMHDAEALIGTPTSEWRKTLGGEVPHVDLDTTRGMWRAWLNVEGDDGVVSDPGYERAKIRGEWITRLGAIRRLRNHVPVQSPQDRFSSPPAQQQRPEPGGGSTSLLDDLVAARRQHVHRGIGGTIKHAISMAVLAVGAIVVVLVLVLGLWEGFVRDAITPARPLAPVVHTAAVPEPVVAPVPDEEPVVLPPARRRSAR
jgi:hypothetical protein